MADDGPNILHIFADRQYARAMSSAVNADIHTLVMNSLAEGGVRFDRADCTFPTHLASIGLDLLRTIRDRAGVDTPDRLDGRSSCTLGESRQLTEWRDQVVAETWLLTIDCQGRLVRSLRYRHSLHRAR